MEALSRLLINQTVYPSLNLKLAVFQKQFGHMKPFSGQNHQTRFHFQHRLVFLKAAYI